MKERIGNVEGDVAVAGKGDGCLWYMKVYGRNVCFCHTADNCGRKYGDHGCLVRKLAKEQGQGRTDKVLSARLDVSRKVEASVLLGTLGMIVGRMVEARKVG